MGKNIQKSDEALMLRVQKGDVAAFEVLYERYNKRLFHFILRFVRERPMPRISFRKLSSASCESEKLSKRFSFLDLHFHRCA